MRRLVTTTLSDQHLELVLAQAADDDSSPHGIHASLIRSGILNKFVVSRCSASCRMDRRYLANNNNNNTLIVVLLNLHPLRFSLAVATPHPSDAQIVNHYLPIS